MQIVVLNTLFESVHILDTFESLIWTDRYNAYGDFQLDQSISQEALTYLQEDYYLYLKESEHTMIVESIRIKSDVETGNKLVVKGRSLESILDRRIVWFQTTLSGNLQNGIKKLLTENVISPSDSNRKISNFIFEASDDPAITSLTIEAQYTGDNLYTVIKKLCEQFSIGFKITLVDDKFVFKLYAGANRSYDQMENPYVVFSPNFENIVNSDYYSSKAELKTIALVAGEGEGSARKTSTVAVAAGAGTGLNRRELYVDARDISQTVGEETLTDAEYTAQLNQRGNEKMEENTRVTAFDGQMETTRLYIYGEDFFMGDIVQISNEYGIEAKVRVVELIRSQSITGIDTYPTFTTTE